MSIPHNENSRVKIPALVHFTRLGYDYLSLKDYSGNIDEDTNIFVDTFRSAINRINRTNLSVEDVQKIIGEIKIVLSADDLGKAFCRMLISGHNGLKLIDFDLKNGVGNTFQVVTELTYKNGNDEFRPDITVLINGIPLSFLEVKKPNNKDGIQAEYTRINKRFKNKKFRRFANVTQLMVFSNNSEYDDNEVVPLEGAFYAASSYTQLFFSHFREEDDSIFARIFPVDEQKETAILRDTNYVSIKHTPEYATNLSPTSPTNRIITSLFSHDRIIMLLKYATAYVEKTNDAGITKLEKHLMRYPQIFATKAIEKNLNSGIKNGIIWHTQGSGKTALAYYNVRYLKDYYQSQGIIAKFYFVVDRLDLLTLAADKGKIVKTILTRKNKDFIVNTGKYGEFHFEAIFAPTPMNRYVGESTDFKEIKSKLYILKCSDIKKLEKICREYDFYFIGNNGVRHEEYSNLV